MTSSSDVQGGSAPTPGTRARELLRWIATKNPFYVLSAGLFLAGLWISFGAQAEEEETWALMSGLAGYTLLLAVTACLLVRFFKVWDDVRTLLLLVVLMFLAMSITFDSVLTVDPDRGSACYLGGLALAVLVSEGVLRGVRLRLPALFRVPYYLVLALFFLYPLALIPLLTQPHTDTTRWALFAFSSLAGLIFLTLLPAIRRGPDYVAPNGSPWRWPLYPWVLFGVLAFAVPWRAYLVCLSLHLLGVSQGDRMIFGPYFLVPFGLALTVLLLEIGVVLRRSPHPWGARAQRGVFGVALALPLGLVALTLFGHQQDWVYRNFRDLFAARLGGDPLYVTTVAVAGFYAYAALRRAPLAAEGFTAALLALAFVAPDTLDTGRLAPLQPLPLLAAAALQLGLGLWRRSSWRCTVAAAGTVAAAAVALPIGDEASPWRAVSALHAALLALLLIGAAFNDPFARLLRIAGVCLALVAALVVLFVPLDLPAQVPSWVPEVYPLAIAVVLAGYALLLGARPPLAGAGLLLACWLAAAAWRGYFTLRQFVRGLDYLALSLPLFVVAVLISLAKSGALRGRSGPRDRKPSQATE